MYLDENEGLVLDYRDLLMRYVQHVTKATGSTHIEVMPGTSTREKIELRYLARGQFYASDTFGHEEDSLPDKPISMSDVAELLRKLRIPRGSSIMQCDGAHDERIKAAVESLSRTLAVRLISKIDFAVAKVLYHWPDEESADKKIVAEARHCMAERLPYSFEDVDWLIIHCEVDETERFAIEGVPYDSE